ncbi:probable serine/threonine-protein kinase PBL7 isoform X2 [Papaver somniferum]|uniref:probable serine/threonine-protein kinase PBL7 isoform X2 n=1 Tax=Papaver somniferum TaxID=3469 RepID=UPI000E6F6583|nr:probable serine/threonine-protein kinase PBL7 isoform X2 [Papaver somniferum]
MAKKSSFKFVGSSSNNVEDHTCITKFKFQELAAATKDFASQSLFGQGEYRRTFKGCLKSSGQKSSSQDVAIRQIDDESIFTIHGYHDPSLISAIQMRVLLHHPNIVDLIGYSINDKDQMFLIYDFMPLGSLKDYLHVLLRNKKPLDWNTRMKIAAGAAKGIKYLHDKSTPPVILRNIKPSDILLSAEYHPKLSDFLGFKERIPDHDESSHTSFGLVLLELVSGRLAEIEPSLIGWAKPILAGGKGIHCGCRSTTERALSRARLVPSSFSCISVFTA